jgi:Helix-turn-helix.
LRKLREEKGISQEELAKHLRLARTTITMYELDQREPDNETLQRIADFFRVSLDYLAGRTNERRIGLSSDRARNPTNLTPEERRLLDAARPFQP